MTAREKKNLSVTLPDIPRREPAAEGAATAEKETFWGQYQEKEYVTAERKSSNPSARRGYHYFTTTSTQSKTTSRAEGISEKHALSRLSPDT